MLATSSYWDSNMIENTPGNFDDNFNQRAVATQKKVAVKFIKLGLAKVKL